MVATKRPVLEVELMAAMSAMGAVPGMSLLVIAGVFTVVEVVHDMLEFEMEMVILFRMPFCKELFTVV